MTKKIEQPNQADESLQQELDNLLMPEISGLKLAPQKLQVISDRLKQRVVRSAADHLSLITVRWNVGVWTNLTDGIKTKPLWQGPHGNSVLIEFEPGASLPVHRHNWIEEGIVLKGGLQMGALDLGLFDYHLSPAGSRHDRIQSKDGALAFLRGTAVGHTPSLFKEILGGLLPFQGGTAQTVFFQTANWNQLTPGFNQLDLFSTQGISSKFCQMQAGTRIAFESHRKSTECMILSGEVFFGDILLRAGEYLQAPANSFNGEVATDVGALWFARETVE